MEDPDLPFPESVAASQIHKAGQTGADAARHLFSSMIFGGIAFLAGAFGVFAPDLDFNVGLPAGKVKLGGGLNRVLGTGGVTKASLPSVSPAYIGVGYVIGPKLASLNFSGTVLAWGLLIPALIYFLGPQIQAETTRAASRLGGALGTLLARHCSPYRRRRHDGGRGLYHVPHA